MSNIRPTASFSVGGTDLTLLSRPGEPTAWIKTRRTVSLPLWQHLISVVGRVQPPALTYREDLQHFRLQAPGAVSLAWYLAQRSPLPETDFIPMMLGLLSLLDQWHRRGGTEFNAPTRTHSTRFARVLARRLEFGHSLRRYGF